MGDEERPLGNGELRENPLGDEEKRGRPLADEERPLGDEGPHCATRAC